MKETLKSMKHMLIEATYEQVQNLDCANYEELGEAIDMIKDIEETLYYCAVVEAMEQTSNTSMKMQQHDTMLPSGIGPNIK